MTEFFFLFPQLPWSEHDNQFSIMYQLGSGKTPQVPSASLSEEGHRFLAKCFTIDVKLRPTAIELLSDPFVMVSISKCRKLIICCSNLQETFVCNHT